MMRTVAGRIERLENHLGTAPGKKLRVIICRAGWPHPLGMDKCLDILRGRGFLPDSPGVSCVDFLHLPLGTNAEELERYLGENGGELCRPRGAQTENGSTELRPGETAK